MLIEEIMKGVINEPNDAIARAANLVALSSIAIRFRRIGIRMRLSFHKNH
jgi:hypothetical protein